MKICPKCGAQSDKKKFIGSFCIDCNPIDIKLSISKLVYTICKECGRIKIGNRWMDYTNNILERYLRKKTKGEFNDLEFDKSTGTITYYLTREGESFTITKNIKVVENKGLCNICSRRHGGYYEAILQFRSVKDGDIDKTLRVAGRVKARLLKLTFISREVMQDTGIDFYVGDKKIIGEVLKGFGLAYKKTYKLYGVKEGKRVYRTTYIVRV